MPRRRLKRNSNRKQNIPKVVPPSTEPSVASAGLDFLSSFDNVSISDATAAVPVPNTTVAVTDDTIKTPPVPSANIVVVSKESSVNAAAAAAAATAGPHKPETCDDEHAKTPTTDGDNAGHKRMQLNLGVDDGADTDDDDYDEQQERTPNAVAMKSYFAGDKWKQETTTRQFTTWTSAEVNLEARNDINNILLCTGS